MARVAQGRAKRLGTLASRKLVPGPIRKRVASNKIGERLQMEREYRMGLMAGDAVLSGETAKIELGRGDRRDLPEIREIRGVVAEELQRTGSNIARLERRKRKVDRL